MSFLRGLLLKLSVKAASHCPVCDNFTCLSFLHTVYKGKASIPHTVFVFFITLVSFQSNKV